MIPHCRRPALQSASAGGHSPAVEEIAMLVELLASAPDHPERRGIELAIEDLFVDDAHAALVRLDAELDAEDSDLVRGEFVRPGIFVPRNLCAGGFLYFLRRVVEYDEAVARRADISAGAPCREIASAALPAEPVGSSAGPAVAFSGPLNGAGMSRERAVHGTVLDAPGELDLPGAGSLRSTGERSWAVRAGRAVPVGPSPVVRL